MGMINLIMRCDQTPNPTHETDATMTWTERHDTLLPNLSAYCDDDAKEDILDNLPDACILMTEAAADAFERAAIALFRHAPPKLARDLMDSILDNAYELAADERF